MRENRGSLNGVPVIIIFIWVDWFTLSLVAIIIYVFNCLVVYIVGVLRVKERRFWVKRVVRRTRVVIWVLRVSVLVKWLVRII